MSLGGKIQRLRKAQGLSQQQLADMTGVSRQAVSKWELSEAMPDIENILQLSSVFGVSTDYLLNDSLDNDMDFLPIQESGEKAVQGFRNNARKASYWLIGIGLFGIMAMWITSCFVPAIKMVPDYRGAPVGVEMMDMEKTLFYTSIDVRGDLGAFLETFKLTPLFLLFCAATVTGIVILMHSLGLFSKKKLSDRR